MFLDKTNNDNINGYVNSSDKHVTRSLYIESYFNFESIVEWFRIYKFGMHPGHKSSPDD